MLVGSQTLTVNAAFFQEIKEDNREFQDCFAATCLRVRDLSTGQVSIRNTVDLLERLRDQLAMHFALEEAYGYFDSAVDVAPHLSEEAEQLRAEHGTLYLALCEVVEIAVRRSYHERPSLSVGSFVERFRQFREDYLEHEPRENELILAAFDDDIGVGD